MTAYWSCCPRPPWKAGADSTSGIPDDTEPDFARFLPRFTPETMEPWRRRCNMAIADALGVSASRPYLVDTLLARTADSYYAVPKIEPADIEIIDAGAARTSQ